MAGSDVPVKSDMLFENPFHIEDIAVFDDETLEHMLAHHQFGLTSDLLAHSFHGVSAALLQRIAHVLPAQDYDQFIHEIHQPCTKECVESARRQILDNLFWELVYWKIPEVYEELTEGERLHPGIFQQLGPELRAKTVLDAGAGSGRASFECVRYGAERVFAVDPSPGLLRILRHKVADQVAQERVIPRIGRFDALPLEEDSVDVSISCSAFTADPEQGGEEGLAEMKRVTRPGGKLVIIWPRVEDHDWFQAHGFQYVALPLQEEMRVFFRSLETAVRCARLFYAHNPAVMRYLVTERRPDIPFSVLGMHPPRDYFWLENTERK